MFRVPQHVKILCSFSLPLSSFSSHGNIISSSHPSSKSFSDIGKGRNQANLEINVQNNGPLPNTYNQKKGYVFL